MYNLPARHSQMELSAWIGVAVFVGLEILSIISAIYPLFLLFY